VVDAAKYIPEVRQNVGGLATLSKYAFAVLFALVRVIVWPVVSFDFWRNGAPWLLGPVDGKTLHSEPAM
jgi:hypothetical protein